jgi:hypothetical protein
MSFYNIEDARKQVEELNNHPNTAQEKLTFVLIDCGNGRAMIEVVDEDGNSIRF